MQTKIIELSNLMSALAVIFRNNRKKISLWARGFFGAYQPAVPSSHPKHTIHSLAVIVKFGTISVIALWQGLK